MKKWHCYEDICPKITVLDNRYMTLSAASIFFKILKITLSILIGDNKVIGNAELFEF